MLAEQQIKDYIEYVILHPLENVYTVADRFFLGAGIKKTATLAVPALVKIPSAKRSTVVNIIKAKTGYSVVPEDNARNTTMLLAKVIDVAWTALDVIPFKKGKRL